MRAVAAAWGLVVDAEATAVDEPGEGALDHPALGSEFFG
jgi:hypothetical protein